MGKVRHPPRFSGSIGDRVHAFTVEVCYERLAELYRTPELTPEQLEIRTKLELALALVPAVRLG